MGSDEPQSADGRRLRYQHRRPELLHAVVEYVLENGIADLSLRPLATKLGVTHATLLRHFATKEALLGEVVAHIRTGLSAGIRQHLGDVTDVPTALAMTATWRELRRADQQRQFLLLFELTPLVAREPDRFPGLPDVLIDAFLEPMERNLIHHGRTKRQAREGATCFLALVRGLQLDLAISGDGARVDAAMRRYIDLVNSPN